MHSDHDIVQPTTTRRAVMTGSVALAGGLLAANRPSVIFSGLGLTQSASAQENVELRVVGFRVAPDEQGLALDQAYQQFLADFQSANPSVSIDSLETPPEFDTQLLVDLAAGTAPDVWAQDSASLAPLIQGGYVKDMRACQTTMPEFNFDRFYPNVLALHQQPDGSIYGVPNDFTPVLIYYNPEAFQRAGVPLPQSTWTWEQFVNTAQLLTLDSSGRNRLDPAFDAENVVQWGYRVRQYSSEWQYRVWQNGGEILSSDGTTATGYLDSTQTIEAIQFHANLLLQEGVSPVPAPTGQANQSVAFTDRFLSGEFAMFSSGHWELVGLQASPEYTPARVGVVGQPGKVNTSTAIYESSWVIRGDLEGAKLDAACRLVEAATNRQYQDTKVLTGIAISATPASAQAAVSQSTLPEIEQIFLDQVPNGRPTLGARFAQGPVVEDRLDSMMERILLTDADVTEEVSRAVEEINRELKAASR